MNVIMVILLFFSFFVSKFIFNKASGSLKLENLNLISAAFYYIVIFCFVGTVIIASGFRDHYLLMKIYDSGVIDRTIIYISYTMVAFPLSISLFNRFFIGRHIDKRLSNVINDRVYFVGSDKTAFFIAVITCLLGSIAIVYVFVAIGVIPLIELFTADFSPKMLRAMAKYSYTGNIYVKNLLMMTLIPAISYLAYVYMRVSIKKTDCLKWRVVFICLFFMSIISVTYDLEKAPVVLYVMSFLIIEVLLANKNIKRIFSIMLLFSTIIIALQYIIIARYNNDFFSLSTGPFSRIFITSIATLFLHVQSFPDIVDYLHGSSLPGFLTSILGLSESWVRSGRVIMQIYNPSGIMSGTSGVMNSLFIGEAYANWGTLGLFISPVYVGFVFSIAYSWFLNQKKTPYSIALYVMILMSLIKGIMGGIVGYLYNASLFFLIILFAFLSILNSGSIYFFHKRKFVFVFDTTFTVNTTFSLTKDCINKR